MRVVGTVVMGWAVVGSIGFDSEAAACIRVAAIDSSTAVHTAVSSLEVVGKARGILRVASFAAVVGTSSRDSTAPCCTVAVEQHTIAKVVA